MSRVLAVVSTVALVALLGCSTGIPGCDDPTVADALVAKSAEVPWRTAGDLIVSLAYPEERSYSDGWGYECRGLVDFQKGTQRIILYRVQPIDYLDRGWDVGFSWDGPSIPKSEWDAGRRE